MSDVPHRSWWYYGEPPMRVATVTLTDAEIKALPSTTPTIIPAPGANKYLSFVAGVVRVKKSDGAYIGVTSSALAISFWPVDVDVASLPNGPIELGVASDVVATFLAKTTAPGGVDADYVNQPWVLVPGDFGASNYTGGHADNTLKVTVYYIVVDL